MLNEGEGAVLTSLEARDYLLSNFKGNLDKVRGGNGRII
jgi:hypothetical protein